MKRSEWLKQLEKELRKLPKKEREDVIEYYVEYLNEAGPENEEEVLKGFGNPAKVAAEIKADYAISRLEENEERKKGPRVKWILLAVLGGIVSAPITFPLIAMLVAFVGVGVLCVIALIIALAACVLGGFLAGVCMVFYGAKAIVIGQSGMGALLGIGTGLVAMALMAMAGYGVFVLMKKFISFVSRKVKESNMKRKAKKEAKQYRYREENDVVNFSPEENHQEVSDIKEGEEK